MSNTMSTECFRSHPSDDQQLHKSVRKLDRCKCYSTDKYDNTEKMIAEVDVLTCDCLWRIYQREAERIVAPGGKLIADPIERNARINATYAAMWLSDSRFEWAGLAAFASKQVGCGLLHAATNIQRIQGHQKSLEEMWKDSWVLPGVKLGTVGPYALLESMEQSVQYVYDILALGNTSLFLDIYPLHMFYKKRGIKEMKTCLQARRKINDNPKRPLLWPAAPEVTFGLDHAEIIPAFEAIEAGDIFESVRLLALHEQQNILQPAIYNDNAMRSLLQGNQGASAFAFVTNLSTGFEQPVQLTLANQCSPLNDGRSVAFSNSFTANLANLEERMPFVLRAARQFHGLLHSPRGDVVKQSIREIANGEIPR